MTDYNKFAATYRYTSRYIIPGRRAGNIKQIINYDNNDFLGKACVCPSPINNKIINNSNPDVIPLSTQKDRVVNAIKYARGGRVVYGNAPYNSSGVTLFGRVAGGYEPPIKNKF
jgi:hypothetical protein